jgi:hypothetical protein
VSYLERVSVAFLVVVTVVAVLVKVTWSGTQAASVPSPAAPQTAVGTVVVTGDAINLRGAPTRSASVLARAERGSELELLSTQDDWYNVRWGEGTVWLSKLYASPVDDCPAGQAATPEGLRRRLTGEWKGEVQGRPATFVFYTRGERLCAYVLYDNVKEVFDVEEAGPGALNLAGKRYEWLAGTRGDFSLDRFSGQLEEASGRLEGTYIDTQNHQGRWSAERQGASSG